MKKICLVVGNTLPVPAVMGGAVEELITMLLDQNEIEQKALVWRQPEKELRRGNMPLQWHSESRESYTVCVPISYRMKTEM